MSELRWILLIAGVALIVALYVFGRRNRKPPTAADLERSTRVAPPPPPPRPTTIAESPRLEPRMTFGDPRGEPPVVSTGSAPSPTARPAEAPPPQAIRREPHPASTTPRAPQKIIAIRVTAAHPARFDGAVLREVVTAARFTHGRYDIFHRLDAEGRPIMSLASLLEPGTFDPATMDSAAYPGIAIFTVMPGPVPAVRAFDELLDVARGLAHRLGGQLQDDRGAPLSVQRVFKLREEVVAFERSLGSAGHA
jgi:cell division protein ZipA